MTTKNYKLSLKLENEKFSNQVNIFNFSEKTLLEIYDIFNTEYKNNLIDNDTLMGSTYGFKMYDINNTSVICSSKMGLKVSKKEDEEECANLRIIGVEDIINQTEKEIEAKGFKLEKIL